MSTRELSWTTHCELVSIERVVAVQHALGVQFPANFLECVLRFNGGRPEPHCFPFLNSQWNETEEGSFGALLDFREPMDEYLKRIYRHDRDLWRDMDISPWWTIEDENLLERPPHFTSGLIAFAEDAGGNYICFDYRAGKSNPDPPVMFWHHEFHSGGEEPFFVSRNFDALLDLLRPCEFDLAQLGV